MIHVHVSLVRNLKLSRHVNKNLYSQVICFYLRNGFAHQGSFLTGILLYFLKKRTMTDLKLGLDGSMTGEYKV